MFALFNGQLKALAIYYFLPFILASSAILSESTFKTTWDDTRSGSSRTRSKLPSETTKRGVSLKPDSPSTRQVFEA